MNTFLTHLFRLSHAQLFAHGYLDPRTAARLAARAQTQESSPCVPRKPRRRRMAWPRLAIPH